MAAHASAVGSISPPRVAVAIMAAGKGTRLKSQLPKVLHEVGGKPLLAHVIAAATRVVPPADVFAIIGHQSDLVRSAVAHTGVNFILQSDQRGTGHALMVAQPALSAYDHVIVLSGDAPQITPQTIARLLNFHLDQQAAMTLLSADLEHPTGYGRVIRKSAGSPEVQAIVEEKSASPAQKKIHEINAGFYVFARAPVALAHSETLHGQPSRASTTSPTWPGFCARPGSVSSSGKRKTPAKFWAPTPSSNSRPSTSRSACEMPATHGRGRHHFLSRRRCVIDDDVEIAADTVIEPFVQILGQVAHRRRLPHSFLLRDSQFRDRPTACSSVRDAFWRKPASAPTPHSALIRTCGPAATLEKARTSATLSRPRRSSWARDRRPTTSPISATPKSAPASTSAPEPSPATTMASHKHTTVIEDGAFIGSDSTLVAPVRVGKGAYVAAASCITDDVPEDALAIGRATTDRERRLGPRKTRRAGNQSRHGGTETAKPQRRNPPKNKSTRTRFSPCLSASVVKPILIFSSAKPPQTTPSASATGTAGRWT